MAPEVSELAAAVAKKMSTDSSTLVLGILTVAIAAAALGLSIWSLVASLRVARDSRWFDLDVKLREQNAQAGRRLMFDQVRDGHSWGWVYENARDDWERVNYAMGLFQTMGVYRSTRAVRRKMIRQIWYSFLHTHWNEFEDFIDFRRTEFKDPGNWDDFVKLGHAAVKHQNRKRHVEKVALRLPVIGSLRPAAPQS